MRYQPANSVCHIVRWLRGLSLGSIAALLLFFIRVAREPVTQVRDPSVARPSKVFVPH